MKHVNIRFGRRTLLPPFHLIHATHVVAHAHNANLQQANARKFCPRYVKAMSCVQGEHYGAQVHNR